MRTKIILLVMLSCAFYSAACQKQNAATTNANNANTANTNAEKKVEKASGPKGVKAPEPCAYFESSIGLTRKEYKANPANPSRYYCSQFKPMVNYSGLVYEASGDANLITEFYLALNLAKANNEKQNGDLQQLLALAVTDVADKASGQKVPEDVLKAILVGETKTFDIEPNANETRGQIKTIAVQRDSSGSSFKYSVRVIIKY